MSIRKYDVIIVGAGPAGCSCALGLKDSNLSVLLIDKSTFPRDKVCGDLISARSIKLLHSIDPETAVNFKKIPSLTHIMKTKGFHNEKMFFHIGWKSGAYICKRKEFDNFLLNSVKSRTNIEVLEDFKVDHFKRNSNSIIVGNKEKDIFFETKLVIGGDGARSSIAKHTGHRKHKRDMYVALRSYVTNVNEISHDTNEVYTHKRLMPGPGYFWIFPLSDNSANIGYGTTTSNIKKNKLNLKKYMNDLIKKSDIISNKLNNGNFDKIYSGIIPIRTSRSAISGERYMLIGDAASLVDPISGGGIENAILSGIIAAKTIKEAFIVNNFTRSYLKTYDKELYRKIGINYYLRTSFIKLCTKLPGIYSMTIKLARLFNINKLISTRI